MTSTKKKILKEILPLRVIREVEKWPVLYTRDCPEAPNVHFKNKIWHEVAKALLEDWDTYSPAEKQCKVMEVTKKWRNLRDTFKRHVILERKIRAGHNIHRKPYVYYKHMAFLLPHLRDADADEHAGAGECAPSAPPAPPRRRRVRAPNRRTPAPAPPDIEHIDEDKHFLMSLLPSLKRMRDDDKLTAKMEILKVIKDVHSAGRSTAARAADSSGAGVTLVQVVELPDSRVKEELLNIDEADFSEGSSFSETS